MNAVVQVETPKQAARRLSVSAGVGFEAQALHEYRDASDQPIYWRMRLKDSVSGEKWIRPMHWNGSAFVIGEPLAAAEGKPLYHLPELLAADPSMPVFIVEGEWCADHLRKLGLIVTTSGSAASASGADWTSLKSRHCLLWPDYDAPGRKYADEVASRLRALGCTVEIVDVSALGLPDKGDIVDWLALHPNATASDVIELARTEVTKSGGDNGDSGDTLRHKASDVPAMSPAQREVGDSGPRSRFELITDSSARPPGVYWIDVNPDRETGDDRENEPEWICSPMVVAATTRDNSGTEWGRLLAFTDRDGLEHRWAMPMTMMATDGAELRVELLRQGLEIATSATRRKRLLEFIQQAKPSVSARCVTRTGWHGDAFALPDRSLNDTAEPVIYQAASLEGIGLAIGGTMEGWRSEVSIPCIGNSRLVMSISAGFAGPCLGLLGVEGGGLHLRGSSSVGKSTALQIAGSVFGLPEKFVRTWRQTDNALEGVASLHSDLLLILDEIGELDPKHAAAVAYMLANGQGKGRANRTGGARAAARWRLLFLSSGEVSLGDLVTQSGGTIRAGQEVRVIDIPADAGCGHGLFDRIPEGMVPGVFADQLKVAAASHYGHALPAFLEMLTSDVIARRAALLEMRDAMAAELSAGTNDGQVRRVAQRFALIAAAGELATHFGLTGWPPEEAERAVRACFRAWLDARGGKGNAEPAAMIAAVRSFLGAHGDSRFTPWGADDADTRTVNRAGYRRTTDKGPEYYIEVEAFRREVTKGFDAKAVAQLLADHDALLPESPHRLNRKERLPDGRSTRVYRILPKLWEVEL